MNKALSPLIAGIILIAFTIVAGILVTSALTSVTKQQTETTTIKQQCPLASLEILSASCKITNITGEAQNWWDSSYSFRQTINITNNAGSILEKDYTVSTEFDLNTCVSENKCLASGNDTRVVWYNTTSGQNQEIDRILEPSTALSFDGSDDYVNPGDILSSADGTIEMWFKLNQPFDSSVTTSQYLYSKDPTGGTNARHLYFLASDGRIRFINQWLDFPNTAYDYSL